MLLFDKTQPEKHIVGLCKAANTVNFKFFFVFFQHTLVSNKNKSNIKLKFINLLSNYIDVSAHLGLCPFGIVSIWDCMHSGWCRRIRAIVGIPSRMTHSKSSARLYTFNL